MIDSDRTSLFKTLLINKGTAEGLRVGLPVLADQGVVGRIIETSWHASRVLLMIDENSNIDALIQRSRAQGILQGAGSAGCNLKYISRAEEVQTGDVVLSSGLAGVFPKGLLLGVVTGVSRKEGGLFQKIDVAPAVDFGKLEEVMALIIGRGSQAHDLLSAPPVAAAFLVIVQITILDLFSLGWIGMEISLIVVIYAGFHLDALRGGILSLVLGFFLDCLTSAIFGLYTVSLHPHLLSLHDRRGKGLCGKTRAYRLLHGTLHASGRPGDRSALPLLLRHRHPLCDPEDLHPAGRRGGTPEPPFFPSFPPFRGFSACRRYTTGSTGMSRDSSRSKFRILFIIVSIALTLIVMRLWYLQVIKGDELRQRSENNSVRLRKIKPMRGLIMDAERQVLVDNQPSFDLVFVPNRTKDVNKIFEKIRALYAERSLTPSSFSSFTGKMKPLVPVIFERNISMEKLAVVETHALELPGVVVEVTPVRQYLNGR